MATLVIANGALKVSVKYTTRKPDGSLVYQRRVPKDLRDHYGSVFMPRRTLARLSVPEIAKKVAEWAKRDEVEWDSLRLRATTPQNVAQMAENRLKKWLEEPRVVEPGDVNPTDAEHLSERLDDLLLDEYGQDYYELAVGIRSVRDHKAALRSFLSPVDFATFERVMAMRQPTRPLLSCALKEYLSAKGFAFERKSGKGVQRALEFVFDTVGDKELGEYTRADARSVRAAILASGVKSTSARRRLNDIKAVFNSGKLEFDVRTVGNPFEKLDIANEGDDAVKRQSFTVAELHEIARVCLRHNDDAAWIIALMLDTGARLGEIAGLRSEDLYLDEEIPNVWIRPNKALGRTLKTATSERRVPLLGMALWGARAAWTESGWLFPRYAQDGEIKSGSASARLNPWLAKASGTSKTCHSLRHSMVDRLRAANVSEEARQAIVGHGSKTTQRKYGEGFSLQYLSGQMRSVAICEERLATPA